MSGRRSRLRGALAVFAAAGFAVTLIWDLVAGSGPSAWLSAIAAGAMLLLLGIGVRARHLINAQPEDAPPARRAAASDGVGGEAAQRPPVKHRDGAASVSEPGLSSTAPDFKNPAAAWWTPRRFSLYLLAGLIFGVLALLDGALWQPQRRAAVTVVFGVLIVLGDLLVIGACANRQGWRWFLRNDNSTTNWYRRT